MTDLDRIESDREWREGISPLVIEVCCECTHLIEYCECASQGEKGLTNE